MLLRRLSGRLIGVAKITVGLAAVSFFVMWILAQPGFDNTRAYEGADARAGELLVGAALALVYRPSRVRTRPPVGIRIAIDAVGLAALGIMLWMIVSTSYYSLSLYQGGFILLTLATALVVASVSYPASLLGSAFSVPPLRWIGERSYGIYLWHMPVAAFTTPSMLDGVSVPLVALQVTLTLTLAALSWRLIENPIRQHGFIDAFRRPVARTSLPLTTAVVVALASCSYIAATADGDVPSAGISADSAPSTLEALSTPEPTDGGGRREATLEADPPPSWQAEPCDSVVHVGDSTSVGLMDPNHGLTPRQRVDAQYRKVGVDNVDTDILGARSIVERYKGQPNAQEATANRMNDGYDGCWVFAMGTNEVANQAAGGVVPLDERIDRLMNEIDGQPALWLTVKTHRTSGPWANVEMEKWNDALRDACKRYPNLRVYDWASEARDRWYLSDGIHFTNKGNIQRARRVAKALAVAYPFEGPPSDDCFVTSD